MVSSIYSHASLDFIQLSYRSKNMKCGSGSLQTYTEIIFSKALNHKDCQTNLKGKTQLCARRGFNINTKITFQSFENFIYKPIHIRNVDITFTLFNGI